MPKVKPKVIGIVGSRRRDSTDDLWACRNKFQEVASGDVRLVSGGCPRGGDRFAEILAKDFGLTITIHYPDWDTYGKGAGFVRNTKIAEDCNILIAVVAEDRTGGTEDTIKKATKLGKKVYLV